VNASRTTRSYVGQRSLAEFISFIRDVLGQSERSRDRPSVRRKSLCP